MTTFLYILFRVDLRLVQDKRTGTPECLVTPKCFCDILNAFGIPRQISLPYIKRLQLVPKSTRTKVNSYSFWSIRRVYLNLPIVYTYLDILSRTQALSQSEAKGGTYLLYNFRRFDFF